MRMLKHIQRGEVADGQLQHAPAPVPRLALPRRAICPVQHPSAVLRFAVQQLLRNRIITVTFTSSRSCAALKARPSSVLLNIAQLKIPEEMDD